MAAQNSGRKLNGNRKETLLLFAVTRECEKYAVYLNFLKMIGYRIYCQVSTHAVLCYL